MFRYEVYQLKYILQSHCVSVDEVNHYIILDGLEGDTRIYCQRCQQYCPSRRRG